MDGIITWHQGRCGSSVLGNLLNQHQNIQSANEIFSRYMPRRRGNAPIPNIEDVLTNHIEHTQKPILNIEIKYLRSQNISLYQKNEIEYWFSKTSEFGFNKHILIHRRNGLRRILSHLMAQRTGIYVQKEEKLSTTERAFNMNCLNIQEGTESRGLLEWLDHYEESYLEMRQALRKWCRAQKIQEPLEIIFEESIESNPIIAYKAVCDWLVEKQENPQLYFKRINPEPFSQLIKNWNEIKKLVEASKHAWMVNE